MNINRSGYYKWKERKGVENIYQKNRNILTELLQEAHTCHPSYGYHRLAHKIRGSTGWIFSDNLAHKCCKHSDIHSAIRNTYKYRKPGQDHIRYPNTVLGRWEATKPLEIVVSDMTILKHRGKNYEWTFLLDTFDNSIISSHVSGKTGDVRPYYKCLDDLKTLTKEKTASTVLHTDQGAVYSSAAYNNGLSYYNIKRSMSRAGTPTDNPIIESINGWIKEEIYSDFDIDKEGNIDLFLQRFVMYFNTERPAYALGYLTPTQYRNVSGFP
jgi:transposase InsO family protein